MNSEPGNPYTVRVCLFSLLVRDVSSRKVQRQHIAPPTPNLPPLRAFLYFCNFHNSHNCSTMSWPKWDYKTSLFSALAGDRKLSVSQFQQWQTGKAKAGREAVFCPLQNGLVALAFKVSLKWIKLYITRHLKYILGIQIWFTVALLIYLLHILKPLRRVFIPLKCQQGD